ncbi:MAG: asparagine synthase [Paenibacillus sp.]|nr:asparagine synthase [Paenibacillus sp.]
MCGITGFFDKMRSSPKERMEATIIAMTDRIVHRGPDSNGFWVDPEHGVALGHRRLSIVDLSQEGHQPMMSHGGRYMIVFNGEVYNHKQLRERLEREAPEAVSRLRGHSDTEIMLACIGVWGLRNAVEQFVGMFSFALYDRRERKLHLVRDRMGEKPLYFGWAQDAFLFGSELKALKAHPGFRPEINRGVLALYLRHNYIPAPYSIYSSVSKLQPGCLLTLDTITNDVAVEPYWSVDRAVSLGKDNPFQGDDDEAIGRLEELLKQSIRQQMVADVPLGAFLSGGIDSSTVVAIMQSISDKPVKTFTIGFFEEGYNEAVHAKAVAKHLGTDHTELYVSPEQAMNVIPLIPSLYDEPFSDSSQIPTFLVAQLARKHVTVSLSGDGGDELFGGYSRYFVTPELWNKMRFVPGAGRKGMAKLIRSIPLDIWNNSFNWLSPIAARTGRAGQIGDKMYKLADLLGEPNSRTFYRSMVSHWNAQQIVKDAVEPATVFQSNVPGPIRHYEEEMMYLDSLTYLPDDILVKVDRAGMGVSLESRIPMLDHRIVEYAWSLPLGLKIRNNTGKWLLRQVLYKYIPREIIDRPKKGFGVPIDHWLRGPLREWAEHLLDERKMQQQGYFHTGPIRQKWAEHLSGKRSWHSYLWDVLMFQAWLEKEAN